jgi:hypothetical protein
MSTHDTVFFVLRLWHLPALFLGRFPRFVKEALYDGNDWMIVDSGGPSKLGDGIVDDGPTKVASEHRDK